MGNQTKRGIYVMTAFVLFLLFFTPKNIDIVQNSSDDIGKGSEKAIVCHVPPGNSANAHTITIGKPALKAHLAHGDTEGPCPEPSTTGVKNQKIKGKKK